MLNSHIIRLPNSGWQYFSILWEDTWHKNQSPSIAQWTMVPPLNSSKILCTKILIQCFKSFFCGFQRLPNIVYMCDCSIVAHCCSAVFGAWFDCCWEWPRPRHSTLEKNVEVWKFVSVVILLTRKTWHVNTNHGRRKTAREYWMIVVQAIFCFCFIHISSKAFIF